MAEEITTMKESRPMSANDPLRCQKNYKTQYNNPKKKYLSEKENEQLKKLTKKSPVDNLLNSPYRNENPYDKKTTTKNLLSETKITKRKTRLEKIAKKANPNFVEPVIPFSDNYVICNYNSVYRNIYNKEKYLG